MLISNFPACVTLEGWWYPLIRLGKNRMHFNRLHTGIAREECSFSNEYRALRIEKVLRLEMFVRLLYHRRDLKALRVENP